MDQNKEKKKSSGIWPVFVLLPTIMKLFEIKGTLVFVLIAAAVWLITKLSAHNDKTKDEPLTQPNNLNPSESQTPRQILQKAFSDIKPATEREHNKSYESLYSNDEYRCQVKELNDLLVAGIIDRSEFKERMALLNKEK